MKKISLAILVMFVFILSGCQSSNSIEISGSTSIAPLMEKLVAEYKKDNNIEININADGSSAGIKAAAENISDIGMASRDLKDDESSLNLTTTVIALDAIGIVVNPANEVNEITLDQLNSIYSGKIKNWKEVGGADLPITLISREDGSGTRSAFEEIVDLLNDDDSSKVDELKPVIVNSTGAMLENVKQKEGAIGYVSAGSIDNDIKTLGIDNVLPTSDNILSGEYKISRNFNLVTKDENEEVNKFIEYILSESGQNIIIEEGYTTVK